MESTIIKVDGISCGCCSGKIKKTLKSMKSISNIDIDGDTGEVKLDYDPKEMTINELERLIEDLGFDVVH